MDNELAITLEGMADQLQDILEQVQLTNAIKSCGVFFLGLIAGLIFMQHFWRRF